MALHIADKNIDTYVVLCTGNTVGMERMQNALPKADIIHKFNLRFDHPLFEEMREQYKERK